MFTFGLFTTHIPYVALVAFYAAFMLFVSPGGSEKNSKEQFAFSQHSSICCDNLIIPTFSVDTHSGYFDAQKSENPILQLPLLPTSRFESPPPGLVSRPLMAFSVRPPPAS